MDILNCTPLQWYENETHFLELLKNETIKNEIPLLNVNDLNSLQQQKLVRFNAMIQDMHGPEFYLEKFEVMNEDTKQVSNRIGKYVDIITEINETIIDDGPSIIRNERNTYVGITVPAVNPWAYKIVENRYKLEAKPSNKKLCTSGNPQSVEFSQNFPLPDNNAKVCHLKVYQNSDSLKLNSVCEFIGFLSLDSVLSNEEMEDVEFEAHNPPPTVIPKLHCVFFKHLQHDNPLVGLESTPKEKFQLIRKELLILFTQLLCGDEIAAEYLIYHSISQVYLRKDFMALGKFSLNISNVPKFENIDYVYEIYKFIELLVTKSHYLPMTLENMNELTFIPKKDYTTNRLRSSILQLSANTHLLIDETKLKTGKLNEGGVTSVKALANAIKNQKITYDFTYYQIEFDCDIPFLIFSEGKSMLPSDIHVKLDLEQMHLDTFNEIIQAANHFLKPELLNDIRVYLTEARLVEYGLTDGVQELVQNEFVRMRQEANVSGDDLHHLLVLARLVCISQGKTTLDEECWKRACFLEEKRKERLRKSN